MKNYLIYPTKRMYITQTYNGEYSHIKSSSGNPKDYPIDESCGGSGKDYFYAPCDVVIKRIYGVGGSGTNTIWMESLDKVILANNEESYVTIMVAHPNDDAIKNIKVGDVYKRKEAMFLEGNDGNATGNHFHISVSASKYESNGWQENNKGAWVIKGNAIKPEDAFWVDQEFTEILDKKGLNFKNLVQYIGNTVLKDTNKEQVEVIIDNLRVRDKANGNILGYINKGIYNVLGKEENNGYLWYLIDENMWIATKEGEYTKYYDVYIEEIEQEEIKKDNIFIRIFNFIKKTIKR